MMKKIAFLFIMISQMAISQNLPENIQVIHGGYQKILGPFPASKSKAAVLPNGETMVIVEGCYSYDLIYRFDKNMNFIEFRKLEHKWSAEAKGIEFMNDQLYLFSYKYDKKTKQLNFFSESFNPTNITSTGTYELSSQPISKNIHITSVIVNVIVSEDTSKVILITNTWAVGTEPEMNLSCYDNQMNLLWAKRKIDYDDQDLYLHNFKVDNLGNVYRIHVKNDVDSKSLCYSTYSKSEIATEEVELDNFAYSEITFELSESNSVITMFYGNDLCTAKGICLVKYRNDIKEMGEPQMIEFSDDLLKDELFTGDQPGLFSYRIKNVIQRENGDLAVIAEQELLKYPGIKIDCVPVSGSNDYNVGVTIRGIMVVILSPNGEIRDYYKIPVLQNSDNDDDRLRVASFEFNKNLYIIFNDNPDNSVAETINRNPFPGNGDCVNVMIQIDNDGDMSRFLLPKSPLGSNAIITSSFRIMNEHEIFFSSKMNEFKYLSSKLIIN